MFTPEAVNNSQAGKKTFIRWRWKTTIKYL